MWLYKIHIHFTPKETIQSGDWTKDTVGFVHSEEMEVAHRAQEQTEVGQLEAGRPKAVKVLLLLGTLQFEKLVPPCWTLEGLSECALGAFSSVHMVHSWLESWKCGHSHSFLFFFHL